MRSSAARAWAIDSPPIEPEQSTTILMLLGSGSPCNGISGWKLARTPWPSRSRSATAQAAVGRDARASSTKSRSMAGLPAISTIVSCPPAATVTSCDGELNRASASTPDTTTFSAKDRSASKACSGAWCGARPAALGSP